MTWVVIVTRSPEDINVVGPFASKDAANTWAHNAFFKREYVDCLFRVKQMQEHKTDPRNVPFSIDPW